GHRRIGHITAPATNAAVVGGLLGVQAAMRRAGIGPDSLAVAQGDGRVAGGERAMSELLEQHPAPAGVVCYNGLTAIGAMRAVVRAGCSVPGDVSLVGFDDIDLARWTDPPLTTIAQPKREMGAWAFARLADAEDGPAPPPRAATVRLPTTLIVRG